MKKYPRQFCFKYGMDTLTLLSVVVPMVDLNPRSFKSRQTLGSNSSSSSLVFLEGAIFLQETCSLEKEAINT